MEKETGTKEIGIRIMKMRKAKGYSREQLAELAGISPSFLYEIETAKKGFSASTLISLIHALEVSPDYLLYGRSAIDCEKEIAETLGNFSPENLQLVEKLLRIIYELAANP